MDAGICTINVEKDVPAPIGHYSHAVELANGMVFLSGQKAWTPETGELIDGGIRAQADLIMDNIEAVLRGIGIDLENIVRVQCHLTNVEDYDDFNEVYARRMGNHRPARASLAGYQLRGGALAELVVEAYRSPSS